MPGNAANGASIRRPGTTVYQYPNAAVCLFAGSGFDKQLAASNMADFGMRYRTTLQVAGMHDNMGGITRQTDYPGSWQVSFLAPLAELCPV